MKSDVLKMINKNPNEIPACGQQDLESIFFESNTSPFGLIDSNLIEWLPKKFDPTPEMKIKLYALQEPLNNQELIDALDGADSIIKNNLFSPAQIKYLADKQKRGNNGLLQTNGFSNLFFVFNNQSEILYLIGVVWDKSINKWIPYIYRLQNLYRAWSRGNQIFTRD